MEDFQCSAQYGWATKALNQLAGRNLPETEAD